MRAYNIPLDTFSHMQFIDILQMQGWKLENFRTCPLEKC